ncbi:hypothetical protein F8S09_17425 [Deinococcus sp. SDU3-2]|uniref:Uncharacterized protein n=1 Tax=Deinococcus terrestris TaxID=2651870 RepID=A0A7X1NZN9_9DEIO|nr:hypothetical protein [Deinococcus terrestris]MPY68434.1 hypothetical protein [Deinococcus terrestris]
MDISDLVAAIERQTAVLEEIRDSLDTTQSILNSIDTAVFAIKLDVKTIDSQTFEAEYSLKSIVADIDSIKSDISSIGFDVAAMG